MGDTEKQDGAGEKEKRDRSPAFPFISLKVAVQRIEEFAKDYERHPALVPNAVKLWKYTEKSSGGQQTIAALKAYGLLDDTGTGTSRKVGLTDLARTILHDKRPGAKEEALKKAALKPSTISDQLARWGEKRPPDAECLSELHFERSFTQDASKRFLTVYDETIEFANLKSSDKIPPGVRPPTILVGGSGHEGGSKMTQDAFSLDEGQAVLQWPSNLSAESADYFEAWLMLIIKRAKRKAAAKTSEQE